MRGSLKDAMENLRLAHEKLGEVLEMMDPIRVAEERGRARALIEVAMEMLGARIERRS